MPKRFTDIVRNQSERTQPISLIVLHTTEGHNRPGVADLKNLVEWFDNPASQASSHYGIDAEGNKVRMVYDHKKAWTQAAYNSRSLSIEQVGFSSTARKDWYRNYHNGLVATSGQIATWAQRYNLPIKHSTTKGVCQHSDLGEAGGNHNDCGPGYPFQFVIYLSRYWYYAKKPTKGPFTLAKMAYYKQKVYAAQKKWGVPQSVTYR